MRLSSRFAPQTRETSNANDNSVLHFVVSHHRKKVARGERVTRRQYRVASATDCRDFGTSITCRDKATCRETIETQGRSTYNATARSFLEDSTRRIASRGFNPFGTCDDCVALSACFVTRSSATVEKCLLRKSFRVYATWICHDAFVPHTKQDLYNQFGTNFYSNEKHVMLYFVKIKYW